MGCAGTPLASNGRGLDHFEELDQDAMCLPGVNERLLPGILKSDMNWLEPSGPKTREPGVHILHLECQMVNALATPRQEFR